MQDYKEDDAEVRQAYEEYIDRREEETKTTPSSVISNIPSSLIIGIFAVILFLMYLTFIKQVFEKNHFYLFSVAFIILIIILGTQSYGKKKELIPEDQLKAILKMKLKQKQLTGSTEIPNGEIEIMLPCKLKKLEGKPLKYTFSFRVTATHGLEKVYTADMDPYDGYLIGYEERPEGFMGTEVTDVKFIRRKEDVWDERYFKHRRRPGGGGF